MRNKIKEMLKSDMYLTMDIVSQLNSLNGSFETYVLYNMDGFDEIIGFNAPSATVVLIYVTSLKVESLVTFAPF